jgi:hypothetical protein
MTNTVQLSRRQAKSADRVGGIRLICLWPRALPDPALAMKQWRATTPIEHAAAERMVRAACAQYDLVPVRSEAENLRRPTWLRRHPGELCDHLNVILIGRRWVHATGAPPPRDFWRDDDGR